MNWIPIAAGAAVLVGLSMKGGRIITPGSSSDGQKLVQTAKRAWKGAPYWLGAGLDGEKPSPPYTDCGKMTADSLSESLGISVARTVTEQVASAPWKAEVWGLPWATVKRKLKPGDLIAYDWEYNGGGPFDRYSHTGIWTGSHVLHASSTAGEVVESPPSYFNGGWRTIYSFTRGEA